MQKYFVLLGALLVFISSLAAPATALSCVPPEPIDLVRVLTDADGAAVGTVRRIIDGESEHQRIELELDAVLKGQFEPYLVLERPASIWGPYYQVGTEVGLMQIDGVVSDGNQAICGPNYTANEVREAAAELGLSFNDPAPQPFFWRILHLLLRIFGL